MIDERLRDQLAERSGDQAAAVLLQWEKGPVPSDFAGLTDKKKRLARLHSFYHEVKSPLLQQLHREPGLEVQDLPGSAQVILRGAPARLLELLKPKGFLDLSPDVRALREAILHTMQH